MRGLIVDNFAGGGGASTGIEMALGRSPDIAVNHDPEAIAMHMANHPNTRHLCGDVWDVKPTEVCAGRPVDLAWFSPTCTHFSRAKGGALKDAKIRALAWVAVRWAREVKPRVICLENVSEFSTWGPLQSDGLPCPRRAGLTFKMWLGKLKACGYQVEFKELRACDYGAPTTRKRLFMVARCDGERIVWPTPTHGPGLMPYATAAECIDWSIPCPSIFGRKRPLAEATMRRIARGVKKFVFETNDPYVVRNDNGVFIPSLIHQGNGERVGQEPRIYDINEPLRTVVAQGIKQALFVAFIEKCFGGNSSPGSSLHSPLSTITTVDHNRLVQLSLGLEESGDVRAFMTKFFGTSTGQPMQMPLGTVTAGGVHHGLVMVHGQGYRIRDIGLRMLTPPELFLAQGFPADYITAPMVNGKRMSKTAQVRMVGNSVCPQLARALVAANVATRKAEAA